MVRRSAGLLVHRRTDQGHRQVLLAHMGGPLWASKDDRAWTVPKGEHGPDEEPEAAAEREFEEEMGMPAPPGERVDLGEVRQPGGKRTRLWAVEGDLDPALVRSATFVMQWPPRSGRHAEFPEVDRAQWFSVEEAGE